MSINGLFQALINNFGMKSDKLTVPLMQSPYVYAAIERIAETLSGIPTKIVRNDAFQVSSFRRSYIDYQYCLDEGKTWKAKKVRECVDKLSRNKLFTKSLKSKEYKKGIEEVPMHPLLDLLDQPNQITTNSQLWKHTTIRLLHDGEAFWILEKFGKEEIKEIWVKSRKGFQPIIDNRTRQLTGWKRTRMGGFDNFDGGLSEETQEFALDEVIRFYKFHPFNELGGLSPLQAGRSQLVQSFFADIFNEAFFEHGADPGNIFMTDEELSPEKKAEIIESFLLRHVGPGKAKKPAILDGGLKLADVMSHKDMEFAEQQKWTLLVVLALYGVPRAMIGGQEDEVNRATFTAAKLAFFELTIIPLLRYYSELFYNKILKPMDPSLFLVFDLARVEGLRGLLNEVASAARDLLTSGFTRNEVNKRFDLDFEDAEWGDSAFGNSALRTYSKLEEAEVERGNSSNVSDTDESEVTNETGDTIASLRRRLQLKSIKQNLESFDVDEFNARFVDPNIEKMDRRLQSFLRKLQKDQLNRLEAVNEGEEPKEKALSPEDLERVLFAREEWQEQISEIARSSGIVSLQSAFSSLQFELGGVFVFDLGDDTLLPILETSVQRVNNVLNNFRNRLGSEFLTGILEGETVQQIAQRFTAAFELEKSRALTVARTETAQVFSQARVQGLAREGIRTKIWVTAGDEQVRKDHVTFGSLPAQPMSFNYMTAVGKGGLLLHPSDANGPANQVINCRCVPLAGDEI